ncbi:MAG: 3-deoxy-8-phosphooctulonate synthase [Chitinophagales bacterium]
MKKFILISGPCVVENEAVVMQVAEHVKALAEKLGWEYVFKSSYKKANRSRLENFTGIYRDEAFRILEKVKTELELPILTDIHEAHEAAEAAEVADYLQIPAFLCRQTDLLQAAGKTGKWVNIKKGQFAAPDAMGFALEKVRASGNEKVMLTERGTTFGYQDLVVDFRSIPEMQKFNCPVIMDATHSLQQPNQQSGVSGGRPELIETICRAGIAVGCDGLFIETHPNPAEALSDGKNMLHLDKMEALLKKCEVLREAVEKIG